MSLVTLKRRSEFLRIRGGARWSTQSFLLEGKLRVTGAVGAMPIATSPSGDRDATVARAGSANEGNARLECDAPARFGFTVTKKQGTAVVRNRIRRRLREIVRSISVEHGLSGCDYVIVARDAALRSPSEQLRADLKKALAQVNRKLTASRR